MKAIKSFILFFLISAPSFAQIDPHTPWVWMKGDNNTDQFGQYGNLNTTSVTSKPGGRVFSSTWKDNSGNLWLFGGMGHGSSEFGYLNDLWKFNIESNNWTWVKGDSSINAFSIYGTKGNANSANKPGSASSPVTWTDANGTLWLFGGFGYTDNNFGFLNTLWKFNPGTNQWTWVNGGKIIDQPGVYGTMGTESNTNRPGARYGGSTWIDGSGNLWMFGGYGYDGVDVGMLNDIWKYNPINNRWTWIGGDKTVNKPGVYGTKTVASASNKPGGRYVASTWSDGTYLWLFGGYGYVADEASPLNDLWRFNMNTKQWTWMSGDQAINEPAVYGIKGTASPENKPGSRYVCSSWMDKNNELWLFGGYGNDAENTGYLNDFWKYSPATNEWVWVKGDSSVDQFGIYGTQGTAAAANKSGARNASVSWADTDGNLWLFGGYGYDDSASGSLNDLWKISSLKSALPLNLLSFSGVMHDNLVDLKWKSEQEYNFSHFNIQRSFNGIEFTNIAAVNGSGTAYVRDYNYTDKDLSTHSTQQVFYRLQLMDTDGSFTYSKILRFDFKPVSSQFTLYPNPASNQISLSFNQEVGGNTQITITGMQGAVVKSQSARMAAGRNSLQIDISSLPAGTYLLTLSGPSITEHKKFIRQ
jgi:hypothetical protein